MANDIRWYVLQTSPGADYEVNNTLLQRSYRTVFPHTHEPVRQGRFRHGRIKPMYPGYLFVSLTHNQSADDVVGVPGRYGVPGARAIIRAYDGNYIRVSEIEIESVRKQALEAYVHSFEPEEMPEPIKVGDWVPAPHGMLVGLPCRIETIDKSGAVEASIGQIKVTFSLSDLETRPRKNSRGRHRLLPSTLTNYPSTKADRMRAFERLKGEF